MQFRNKFFFALLIKGAIYTNMPPNFITNFIPLDARNREGINAPRNNLKQIRIHSFQDVVPLAGRLFQIKFLLKLIESK
jgi:hypothetical protein